MDAPLAEVGSGQQLAIQFVFPLPHARLNGAQQELLGGVFRHLITATLVFHHHYPWHSQQPRYVVNLIASCLQAAQLGSGLTDYLRIGNIVEQHHIARQPVFGKLVSHIAQLLLVGSSPCAGGR